MIRRLIAYCYLGNYDPCSSVALSSFSNLREHTSATPIAQALHSRLWREVPDPCACLMPLTQNSEQSVKSSIPSTSPLSSSSTDKAACSVQVANPLTIHAKMYALAVKYQVKGLGLLARAKFQACLHHHVYTEDFPTAVQVAYSTTPEPNRDLRDAVLRAFLIHFNVNLASTPGIEAKLNCIDELSFLLIKAWPNREAESKPVATPVVSSSSLFGARNM